MQNFKMTLSKDQLNVIYKWISFAASSPSNTAFDKLLSLHMACLQLRLVKQYTFPNLKNRVTLSIPEAFCFYYRFSSTVFLDPFELATMTPILTQIHKQYI